MIAQAQGINSIQSPYPLPLTILAAAFTAAFFSHFVGGDWGSFAICFFAGGPGQALRAALQSRGTRSLAATLVCAIFSAVVAALGLRLHISAIAPATLIASVGYMIPGLPLVNGFIDVLSPKYVSVGGRRIVSALLVFVILAIGVAIGDAVAG